MKRSLKYCAVIVSLTFGACTKFVEIDPPTTQLVASTVFESDGTANSALVTAYAFMVNQAANPFNISLYTGLACDELNTSSTGETLRGVYRNLLQPTDAVTNDIWFGGYNIIYQANAIIEGASNSKSMSERVKKQVIAEAKFLRAFWHFYLTNLYGTVPYVTMTDYTKNMVLQQSSKNEVMKLLISDLIAARETINENYVDGTSINTTESRIRANKSAVSALLARAYLYSENWADAESEATAVINNKALYDLSPLEDVFKANSVEAIFQLMTPQPSFMNTTEGSGYILFTRPGPGGSGSATVSNSLMNSFAAGDLRKDAWVGKISNSGNDYYFPFKYKVPFGAEVTEHSVVLRLTEQYLIRSEAEAQQNKLSDAIADLDVIRKRAGLPLIAETNPAIGKDDLLKAIMKERRVELFTEWGHRFMDLKRTGSIDAVMTMEAQVKGSTWSSYKQNFPIPQKDIDNNKNLKQNDGYLQ